MTKQSRRASRLRGLRTGFQPAARRQGDRRATWNSVCAEEGAGDRRVEGDRACLRRGAGAGGLRRRAGVAHRGRPRQAARQDQGQAQCRGAAIIALDLGDSKNVDTLAAECADTDILVNNAGAIPGGNIAQIDEARWRQAWDLKVFGYINMTRRFYALMARAQERRHRQHPRRRRREPRFRLCRRLVGQCLADGVHPRDGRHRAARQAAGHRHQPRPGDDRAADHPDEDARRRPISATRRNGPN